MSDCQVIPEDLTDIPPGPRLAQALSEITLARLSGFDSVKVLQARYRQLSHDRAQLMAAMVEVGLCGVGVAGDELRRMAVPDEFSADEVRAALVLTRRAADAQFWLAHDLVTRLPPVHAAMDAGVLDEPRARVLSDWTTELSPTRARALCAELLPRAARLTTGQLIEQIKKLAIALDPDWAQRRYEQAIAERKVVGYRNPDGSANLSGYNLPVDRVAAASGHIDALAKAAKHAGDSRPIDHIRTDLFLGMTDGTYTGMDDAVILKHLRTVAQNADAPDDERSGPGDGAGLDDEPRRPDDERDGPEDVSDTEGGGDERSAADDLAQHGPAVAGMELRVRLSTLLGRDEYPAELAGWGPVHADLARDLATSMTRGQWRFAITDEHGHLLRCGITRVRPTGSPTRSAGSRQVVELQIPAATLRDLASGDSDALGGWGPVVTDLAHQSTNAQQPSAGDPARRFPGATLRRYVEIRDRYCVMIGCRAAARSTDTDHTRDHIRGGATVDHNLGNACRHDHRLKHAGGWQLHQPEPGVFRWTSRLGHVYHVPMRPIIESLPDPIPREGPVAPLYIRPNDDWEESSIWDDTRPDTDTKPSPRPPPQSDSHDDPPPF
ncbi:MAG: hypothetical protein DLM62_04255 [Pseudonocardiales bacterium]|nr:MAG: hypothetical protein DLM62_04255 [Pseudonocardiales bacterium]